MIYHVFSDISQRWGSIGYACAICTSFSDPPQWFEGMFPDFTDNVVAEITASSIGLSACPFDAECVLVWTDLYYLADVVANPRFCSYAHKLYRALDNLKTAAALYKRVEYHTVDRQHHVYRACHLKSRKAAMQCAAETGNWKHGMKRKEWPRRKVLPA